MYTARLEEKVGDIGGKMDTQIFKITKKVFQEEKVWVGDIV